MEIMFRVSGLVGLRETLKNEEAERQRERAISVDFRQAIQRFRQTGSRVLKRDWRRMQSGLLVLLCNCSRICCCCFYWCFFFFFFFPSSSWRGCGFASPTQLHTRGRIPIVLAPLPAVPKDGHPDERIIESQILTLE